MNYCSSSGGCGYNLESTVNYSSSPNYDSSSSYNSPNAGYQADISHMVTEAAPVQDNTGIVYESKEKEVYSNSYKSKPVTRTYAPVTDRFLDLNRPRTVFIGSANEIKEFVEQAFTAVTGKAFPDDIIIRVLGKEEFRKANSCFSGKWNNGIQGFAINRKKHGLASEVFIRKGELDRIMLTLGHEIGHVLTRTLEDKRDEEAKAFAFSIAWMKKIKQLNIANLSTSICLDRPAKNGLHDVALNFVLKKIQEKDAYDIYKDLISGLMEVEKNV